MGDTPNTLSPNKNLNEVPDKERQGFVILKDKYLVYGIVDFEVYFHDTKTAFELVLYFGSFESSHYRLRFESDGSYS